MTAQRTALSRSDEWETPQELFDQLCETYDIHPDTDVCATDSNSKCIGFIDKAMDTLKHNFQYHDDGLWCNPPHSETKAFVLYMHEQWKLYNIPIMMLVPAGVLCRKYFAEIFEKFIETRHGVEWHPVRPRPAFLFEGKRLDSARQDYIVIIWRARKK